MIDYYKAHAKGCSDQRELAIRMLECVGAGAEDFELTHIEEDPSLNKYTIQKCTGRSQGLIAITENHMNDFDRWAEGFIVINIDEEIVYFDVCFYYESFDIWYASRGGDIDERKSEYECFPEFNFSLEIPFDNFCTIKDIYDSDELGFRRPDGSVIEWI